MAKVTISFEIIEDVVLDESSEKQAAVKELVIEALECYKGIATDGQVAIIDKLFNDCHEVK